MLAFGPLVSVGGVCDAVAVTQTAAPAPATRRIHPAWWAAAATFLALVGAAGFRAAPAC